MYDAGLMTEPTGRPSDRAQHAAKSGLAANPRTRLIAAGVGAVVVLVVVLVLVLGDGNGPSSNGKTLGAINNTARLTSANNTALNQLHYYQGQVTACKASINCIEAADRTIGNQIHTYANYVGTVKATGSNQKVVQDALNTAQVTANIFEVLGDAQPTQSNYNKVLHHFDLTNQVQKLETAIQNLANVVGS